MTDLMKLIHEADTAAIELEHARTYLETLKRQLDTAKESYDKARNELDLIVGRADELGVPRAKVKKLIEERAQALVASGLISGDGESRMSALRSMTKPAKAPKKLKTSSPPEEDDLATRPANESLIMEMN
ncbi:MAG: hypothetical protein JNL11_08850 [Bdellovibrionaceae bacterium]|nr:hypothetical protein [Pseudobdellovibrionaceae bacterium]